MKVIFTTIHYLLIAAVVCVALLLLGTLIPIPGNFKVKIVESGSMEPTIKTGGIVVIQPSSSYHVGDIITFGPDTKIQVPTTHRVVEITSGPNPMYITKGDANDAPDPANTHIQDIQGKVFLTVPYVGYILAFARKPLGFGLLVGLPAVLIIMDEVGKIIRELRLMRRKKKLSHATPYYEKKIQRVVD